MTKKPRQSEAAVTLERRQLSEIEKLESIEARQKLAAQRRTRGRASLISGSERGIGGDPLFGAKNIATKEKLAGEAAEAERIRVEEEGGAFGRVKRKASLLGYSR